MISARSEDALKATAGRLAGWIEAHELGNGSSPVLPKLTYTLGVRRNHHQHRLTLVGNSSAEVVAELQEFAAGRPVTTARSSFTPRPEFAPRIGFVMSGQGPQWWGMGRELMRNEPVFRETMEACAEAMRPYASFSLLEELARDEADSKMQHTEIAQPAIFAMQLSLVALWKSVGVEPTAVVGHSVGEVAAACVAGILSMEEGARIIVLRARMMHECARGEGTMLAVSLSEDEALELISRHDRTVSIAAFNGPRSLTLAGIPSSLEAIRAELEPQNIFARFVKVDHPYHHAMMQPAADNLITNLSDIAPQEETLPFFSTVTGERCAGKDCVAAHWGRGIRQAVQFVKAVNSVADFGVDVWLEMSSHPALSMSITECLTARGEKAQVTASTRRDREHECFLEAALDLHRGGVVLDFNGLTPSRELLSLPAYPWDRSRWWHECGELREARLGAGGKGLLDARQPRATPTWTSRLDGRHMAYLKDHKVDSHIIFPAAGFVEMALEAGVQLFEGRPFAIEDFEIRRPLILPEPASALIMELTYEPAERTFTIQSKFDGAASWSVHVVGSMRSERTESSFGNSVLEAPGADLEPEGVGAVLRSHERSRTPLRRRVQAGARTRRRQWPIGRAGFPFGKHLKPRVGIRAASGADGRCVARVFRRFENRGGPQGEDETAGAFRADLVPAVAGSCRPGSRQGVAFQRRTHRRPHRDLRRRRPPVRAGGRLPRRRHDHRAPRRGFRWQPRSGL